MQTENIVPVEALAPLPSQQDTSCSEQTKTTPNKAVISGVVPSFTPLVIPLTVPDIRDLSQTVNGTLTLYSDDLVPSRLEGAERERAIKIVKATFELAYCLVIGGNTDFSPLLALLDESKHHLAPVAVEYVADSMRQWETLPFPITTEGDTDNAK